jgi:uncharacterized membrane protein YhhN
MAFMKNRLGPAIYGVLLALHLAALITRNDWLAYATKALLMPALVFWLLQSTSQITNPIKIIALSALLFSWAGDLLLLFVVPLGDSLGANFFLAGLGAFLIAHLFYIYCLFQLRKKLRLALRPALLVPVLLYGAIVFYLLTPHLGGYRIPVLLYGIIISIMLFNALQFGLNPKPNRLIAAGAILFVLSDTFLAWNKFRTPFSGAGILIMFSYGVAQYFLCEGIINLMQEEESRKPSTRETA